MTHLPGPSTAEPSDDELLARVRLGSADAFGQLYERHRTAVRRLARQLAGESGVDGLVAATFTAAYSVLLEGGGPVTALREYLLGMTRRLSTDRAPVLPGARSVEELAASAGPLVATEAATVARAAAIAAAFRALPERWRAALWHVDVEREQPEAVGVLLGLSPRAVEMLADRARDELRGGYLREQATGPDDSTCQWATERLDRRLAGGLPRAERSRFDTHLAGCDRCLVAYRGLTAIDTDPAPLLGPVLLGSTAEAYLAAAAADAAAAEPAPMARLGRAVRRAPQATSAAGIAAGFVIASLVVAQPPTPDSSVFAESPFDSGDPGIGQPETPSEGAVTASGPAVETQLEEPTVSGPGESDQVPSGTTPATDGPATAGNSSSPESPAGSGSTAVNTGVTQPGPVPTTTNQSPLPSATATDTGTSAPIEEADLEVAGAEMAGEGDQRQLEVIVRVADAEPEDVAVQVLLPAETSFTGASGVGWQCGETALDQVGCSLDTEAPQPLVVDMQIDGEVTGQEVVTVEIDWTTESEDTTDPNVENNDLAVPLDPNQSGTDPTATPTPSPTPSPTETASSSPDPTTAEPTPTP